MMMESYILMIIIIGMFLCLVGLGGIITDYIFPHIKPLERWLDNLTGFRSN